MNIFRCKTEHIFHKFHFNLYDNIYTPFFSHTIFIAIYVVLRIVLCLPDILLV